MGSGAGQRSGVPGGTAALPQEAVTPQRPREEREGRGAWVVAVAVPPSGEAAAHESPRAAAGSDLKCKTCQRIREGCASLS